jgi:hypothetical protein
MLRIDKNAKSNDDESDDEAMSDQDEEPTSTNHRGARSTQRNSKSNKYCLTRPILTAFGNYSMKYFRINPRPTFLLGSLDKEIAMTFKKARQQRKAPERDLEEKKTNIKELSEKIEDHEQNTTFIAIENIFDCLKKCFKKNKSK